MTKLAFVASVVALLACGGTSGTDPVETRDMPALLAAFPESIDSEGTAGEPAPAPTHRKDPPAAILNAPPPVPSPGAVPPPESPSPPPPPDCADGDADGVCDVDDLCEGHLDGVDMDADGIPDGCDDTPIPPKEQNLCESRCDDVSLGVTTLRGGAQYAGREPFSEINVRVLDSREQVVGRIDILAPAPGVYQVSLGPVTFPTAPPYDLFCEADLRNTHGRTIGSARVRVGDVAGSTMRRIAVLVNRFEDTPTDDMDGRQAAYEIRVDVRGDFAE